MHCQIKLYQETDILIGVHGAGGWVAPLMFSLMQCDAAIVVTSAAVYVRAQD